MGISNNANLLSTNENSWVLHSINAIIFNTLVFFFYFCYYFIQEKILCFAFQRLMQLYPICEIFKLNIYNWYKKSYSSFLFLSGKISEYLNWHLKRRLLKLYSSTVEVLFWNSTFFLCLGENDLRLYFWWIQDRFILNFEPNVIHELWLYHCKLKKF